MINIEFSVFKIILYPSVLAGTFVEVVQTGCIMIFVLTILSLTSKVDILLYFNLFAASLIFLEPYNRTNVGHTVNRIESFVFVVQAFRTTDSLLLSGQSPIPQSV